MTDNEIIQMMHEHFSGLFPRLCSNCNRDFATLGEYILDTKPVGSTISYDAELGDWEPVDPVGAFALSECPCGTSLALSTEDMPLSKVHVVLAWVKTETKLRGVSAVELIGYVRDEVRKLALAGSD